MPPGTNIMISEKKSPKMDEKTAISSQNIPMHFCRKRNRIFVFTNK
jgi:hypothetical protein